MKSLKNLFSRPKDEILLVFEALFYLLYMKQKLKKHKFNDLVSIYSLQSTNSEKYSKNNLKKIKKIGWAVERTSQVLPWYGLCLVKALASQRMLNKRNLTASIYMGVRKEKDGKTLEAHAWIKCDKSFITGHHDGSFNTVSKFSWKVNE